MNMRQNHWFPPLGAILICGVLARGDAACIPTCAGNVRSNFNILGCASAADAPCLCVAAGFLDGVTQCASLTCGARQDQIVDYLNGDFCQVAAIGAAAASSDLSSSDSVLSSSAAATTTTTTDKQMMSSLARSSYSSVPPATAVSSSTALVQTSSLSMSFSFADSNSDVTSPNFLSSGSLTSCTAGATSCYSILANAAGNHNEGKSDGGVSHAAVIGISVSCCIVGLAVIVFVSYMIRWRKIGQKVPPMSKPTSDQGQTATLPDQGIYEKHKNEEFEMLTQRYEDVPPCQIPRPLV